MRISGFHVDGFGALAEFGIDDLSPGLVILNGPNEAGKSTMLDFFTAMLFGLPARRDNPRFRAPVRGGRHGGWLTLAEGGPDDPGGERLWRIERYGPPRKELAIRRPDGTSASEEELRRALGGADETLFRAVFAVDLTDLGNAEALSRDEVSELLFSASIVGQRRSAARAMANLQKQRLELARTRQGDARANRLLADLEAVRHSLAEAAREAACYPARQSELAGLESEVAAAREEADRIEHRTRELDLLVRLWDVLERKRATQARLEAWKEPPPLAAWLEEQAVELQSLRTACSGHLERVNQLAELVNQRAGIEQSITAALGSVGPGWDRDRVRNSGGWIGLTDEGRSFRASLAELESRWRAASVLAEEAEASAGLTGVADLELATSTTTDADLSADTQARLMGELRRNLAEQRRIAAERQAGEARGASTGAGLGKTAGFAIAVVALCVVALGAVAAAVSGALAGRLLCGLVAVAGCALFAVTVIARRRTPGDAGKDTGIDLAFVHVSSRVAELATSLGLCEAPSDSDLETAAEQIEVARGMERSFEDERRRALAALSRRDVAHESLERERQNLTREQARFEGWKSANGLGSGLSPDGVLESLAALQATWNYLAALERVSARIGQLGGAIAAFEARLFKISGDFRERGGDLESAGTDLEGTLEELDAFAAAVSELRAGRASLAGVLEDCEAEIERSLGLGDRARRLGAELSSGEVLAWNEEQEALTRARVDMRESLERLVRAHQDASNELRALAGSGRIAELEQRRLTLEHDLEEVLRSWALLGCARLLLERTLRRHEQERQPAVLARAAERFAKVTEGRYLSLLPSLGDEPSREAIRVVSSTGAELEAASLSRGSVEQLYLCLRIGLAETFAERAEALPLILDDVLVNFDPARAASVAEVIAETSERHQVLFFTCHPHLKELALRAAPGAQVVELDRL
jgi:uncharacterized protein YhaN